jgi:hypothetical protein
MKACNKPWNKTRWESAAINDAVENNREIQSFNRGHANSGPSSTTSNASEEQEQQQERSIDN